MIRNNHRNHISPSIVLSVVPAFIVFVGYVLNKPSVDAWLRVAIEGDWSLMCQLVLVCVAGVSLRLGWVDMENIPSFNKLCVCQCNDIVSSWEQVLFMDFGKNGYPTWHDEDGEEFAAIVNSWEYKMTNTDRP